MASKTPSGRNRDQAVYYIMSGVRQGMSGASILTALRANGLTYGNEAFYQDYNYYKTHVSAMPTLSPSNASWYNEDPFLVNMPSRSGTFYRYVFRYSAVNSSTGMRETREGSYVAYDNLSPFEAFSQFQSEMEDKYDYIQIDPRYSHYVGGFFYSS